MRLGLLSLIFLTFAAVAVDAVSYPGFFAKYFLLDSRLLTFISLLLLFLLSYTKTTKISKFVARLISLNSYIILPLLAIGTGFLAILERLQHPNFVFTTFHIQYGHLGYVLLLSVAVGVISLKKNATKLQNKVFLFIWLSAFLLYIGLLIETFPNNIFPALSVEDGVLEWLEFLFFFAASVISFFYAHKAFRKKDLLSALVYCGLGLLLFFIAGEEISWGQRVFNIATPDTLRQVNEQGETTLHNLKGVQEKRDLFYTIFSSYFAFAWTLISIIPIKLKRFISPWYLSLFFIPMFLIALLGQFESVWQEYGEFVLSVGMLFYVVETRRKLTTK